MRKPTVGLPRTRAPKVSLAKRIGPSVPPKAAAPKPNPHKPIISKPPSRKEWWRTLGGSADAYVRSRWVSRPGDRRRPASRSRRT